MLPQGRQHAILGVDGGLPTSITWHYTNDLACGYFSPEAADCAASSNQHARSASRQLVSSSRECLHNCSISKDSSYQTELLCPTDVALSSAKSALASHRGKCIC